MIRSLFSSLLLSDNIILNNESLLFDSAEFPTSKLEMTAVADIFDRDGDGYIDYYEFVAALHPNKDAYRPTTDADKIEDEVRRVMEVNHVILGRSSHPLSLKAFIDVSRR